MGFSGPEISALESLITLQRDAMTQKEYDYITGRYGAIDRSPSYVWESQRVADLRGIDVFKGMTNVTAEACMN